MNKRILIPVALLFLSIFTNKAKAQCSCGDGSDGDYFVTTSTTLQTGTYNFNSFTIVAPATVTVVGNGPLIINVLNAVQIEGTLILKGGDAQNGVSGDGVAGGGNGATGVTGSTPLSVSGITGLGPGGGLGGNNFAGGGGAGYATVGFDGTSPGNGGSGGNVYGDIYLISNDGGSGGGSGSGGNNCLSGAGGGGGGMLIINSCGSIWVEGEINANGGNGGNATGNCGGGGAGSGGSIWLRSPGIDISGNIKALGGTGGTGNDGNGGGAGGNGADGRIRIDQLIQIISGNITPTATTVELFATTMDIENVGCFGQDDGSATVIATGSASIFSYLWYDGTTTAQISNLAPGQYTVITTDVNNCSKYDTVTISEPAQLTSTISSTPETGVGLNNGTATVIASGGTTPYTYGWAPSGITSATPTGLSTGTYTVTITDANNCTATNTVHVSNTVSVNSAAAKMSGVNIFPNPASDLLNFTLNNNNQSVNVQVLDNLGRIIATEQFAHSSEYHFNTNDLATGNYILKINTGNDVKNIPFVVVN